MSRSLFTLPHGGLGAEVNLYPTTDRFPTDLCLATDGGFAPLDFVGGPYDSGLRVSTPAGVYQVSAELVRSLLVTRLLADNALVVLNDDLGRAFTELVEIFGRGRVRLGNGCLWLTAPPAGGGVTKLLFAGGGVGLDLENGLRLRTSRQGWNVSSFGGDAQRVGRVLLLELTPGTRLRMTLDGDPATAGEPLRACMALGVDVEALGGDAPDCLPLTTAWGWCVFDHAQRRLVHAADDPYGRSVVRAFRRQIRWWGGTARCSRVSTAPAAVVPGTADALPPAMHPVGGWMTASEEVDDDG